MKFIMDLQLFGGGKGGSSTTNVQSYTPTAEEVRLQKQAADYSEAVAPNALELNNYAMNLLKDSLGTVQVDYNTMNRNAQNQIAGATGNMATLANSNNSATANANNVLNNLSNQYTSAANTANSQLGGLVNSNVNNATNTNRSLGNISGQYTANAQSGNNALRNLSNAYNGATGDLTNALANTSSRLGNLVPQYGSARDATNRQLENISNQYGNTNNAINERLDQLANGYLPSQYQQNMQNAIASTLKGTMGQTVNNLGQRGVLNSSVTSAAMNDISKNAADSVAKQYQGNIGLVSNLLGQEIGNTNATLGQQANLANQRLGNTNNALGSQASLYGQQGDLANQAFNARANALGQQTNIANQQTANTANALGQNASLASAQYGNTANANTTNAGLYGQMLDNTNTALGQRGQYAQQQFENTQNNNSQNSGLYSNLINSATQPIATAAAAQEAAINPAQSLWSSSLGLNGASLGALNAASGKGTTTSTQTTSGGGGGFFSGLLGGIGSGLGGALFCFPAGTKISMADGTEKDIKHIHEGDEVLSDDGSKVTVIEVMKPHYNDVYNIICENGHTSTTLSQPLMKPDGEYILAGDLKIGTELKRVGKVRSLIYSGERKVYDFKTSDDNNYIADGFVAMGGDGSIWGGGN